MQFFDTIGLGQAVEVTNLRETRNGSLVVNARAARGGNVQDYLGAEVGRPDLAIVRVYRDADEIFHKDSLKTFTHKPVTLNHPAEPVTSRTWKDVARGHTGEEVLRDGEFVKIPMMVSDQAAIDAVKGGTRELSVGYQCDLDFTPGTSPSGAPFDARQTKIIVDHVAIVDRGRAGPDCRIGDQRPSDEGKTMRALTPIVDKESRPMKTLTIDGHSVELSDAAVIAVSALQRQNGTLVADNLKLTADLAAATKAKDTEIATKDAEIAKLKAAALDDAKLDALVTARADVIGRGKAIVADLKPEGLSIPAIRRAVVSAKLGDAAVKDRSDDYVEARFDLLAQDATPADPLRQVLSEGPVNVGDAKARADAAHTKRLQDLRDGWKTKAA
jgi:hypothetical protein